MAKNAKPRPTADKLGRSDYQAQLEQLQIELNQLARWLQLTGKRLLVLIEGRDTAGKGGVISAIADALPPRVCKTVALPKPNERESTQWYFQRYVPYLPAAGEMVLFDRSWYNRAGVETVMGYCSAQQTAQFLRQAPVFEKLLVDDGVLLMKYWLCVDQALQEERFSERLNDPLKRWKLSPMDMESRRRWEHYTKAKETMLERTHIAEARWWIIEAVDKKKARLNCIHHLLSQIPYAEIEREPVVLPDRVHNPDYLRHPVPKDMFVPAVY